MEVESRVNPDEYAPEVPLIYDYDSEKQEFNTTRVSQLLFAEEWTRPRIEAFLKTVPDACIFRKVSHNPILRDADSIDNIEKIAEKQRIVIDGMPFIDNFGLYVYIDSVISWYSAADVDLRYPSHVYPQGLLIPELEYLLI